MKLFLLVINVVILFAWTTYIFCYSPEAKGISNPRSIVEWNEYNTDLLTRLV